MLNINEIFDSIQGEGPEIGTPTIFLRLSGCNMNPPCEFCDTKYHKDGTKMKLSEIEDIFLRLSDIYHVTVTGGEPVLQDNEMRMLMSEYIHGYDWSLETNGVLFTTCPYSTIVISPKKQDIRGDVLRRYACMKNTSFKFVYENKEDLWWEDVIEKCSIPLQKIYIMPEGATREEQLKKMPEVIRYCVNKGFKFGARLHVLAFDNKRGV